MDWLRLSLVIPQGFKPWTFRTGICHSISLSIPLFMGIFGIPQKRICADFAPIRLDNALLSVAKIRISEQKAKLIMDFFGWECFEWAQIWKIVQSIWKIFHKIFTFLDKNPIIALSEHWCQSELRIKGRCDWGSTSVHSNGYLQQISLAKGQWSDVILLQL